MTLNYNNLWESNNFEINEIDGEYVPQIIGKIYLIIVDSTWTSNKELENYSSVKGIELKNLILRSVCEFDYKT